MTNILLKIRQIHFTKIIRRLFIAFGIAILLYACYPDENLDVPVHDPGIELTSDLDVYIDENFTQEFGVAVRYKYDNNNVGAFERVTPPRLEVVRPMLDFIEYFWVEPYLAVDNGEEFFRKHVPAEIILLGGYIYNNDGTVTLGTADVGAKITFTNVNDIDPNDFEWRDLQLNTVYHEFAHIVHQRYKLPPSFETITPSGYTSPGSWFVLTDNEAIQRGFVSPYATSSPNEDFAETVAFYLFYQPFFETYINPEENCQTQDCILRNEGRLKIEEKLASITSHYQKVTGVNLTEVRNEVQSRLN